MEKSLYIIKYTESNRETIGSINATVADIPTYNEKYFAKSVLTFYSLIYNIFFKIIYKVLFFHLIALNQNNLILTEVYID